MSWRERLKEPITQKEELAARCWPTCYIGERRIELELLGFRFSEGRYGGSPLDEKLRKLGIEFGLAIFDFDNERASRIADEIDAIIAAKRAEILATDSVTVEAI